MRPLCLLSAIFILQGCDRKQTDDAATNARLTALEQRVGVLEGRDVSIEGELRKQARERAAARPVAGATEACGQDGPNRKC